MRMTVVGSLILLMACNAAPPEQQFVNDVVQALGGRENVTAASMLVMEGRGTAGNLGQDMTWQASGQSFTLTDVRRVMDLAGKRWRMEQTRTPQFLYFQGPQPQRQVSGVDGDVAYAVAPNGNANRQSAAVATQRQVDFYHHPLTIARAMLEEGTTVANIRNSNNARTADVTIGDTTFALTLDAGSLPANVSSPGYHPNLGDVTITTSFADYRAAGDLTLPMRLTTDTDRRVTQQIEVERYSFDASPDAVAAPATAASLPVQAPPPPVVEAIPVTRGVWLLAGQSHHSALVEFADHLLLIEAPQSEARTQAVIAKARELVPGKPLTEMVMSHHHFDHSSGLRKAVSEGLAVVTHKDNAAFVEEMVKRSHARQPDALQRNPKPLTLRVIDGELTMKDEMMTVTFYPIPGNPHADTLVMAYLPPSRVLIQADAYSPADGASPDAYHPYAANLLDTVRGRQLRVDRIVPLHGAIVPFADLVKAATSK